MRKQWSVLCVSILVLICGVLLWQREGGAMTKADDRLISLAATFRVTDANLDIDYSIVNRGASPVFLLDMTVRIDPHGAASVGPAQPRIEYLSPATVILSDKLFRLPPGTRMAVPPSAYGERLASGASKHSSLVLPLPLRDHASPDSHSAREVTCDRIRFVVGAVPDSSELHAAEQVIAGVPLWRLGPAAWSLQREAAVESALSTPVRVMVGD